MTQVHLADVVLMHDSIDENAVKVKCQALYALGQKGLSKAAYESFASQFEDILGSAPDFDYSNLI